MFLLGYEHEAAHVEIFREYNVPAKIDLIGDFPDMSTYPLNHYERCTSDCLFAHNINEIVGYHLLVIYVIFSTLGVIVVGLIEDGFVREDVHQSKIQWTSS